MKINYNPWFYGQHRYLSSTNKDGKPEFTDTKWISTTDRFRKLLKAGSPLLDEQTYGVVGNNYGIDKLFDLMSRSNYTFADVNDSLVDTYRVTLKNAMSRMLVNTHAVIFSSTLDDTQHVVEDRVNPSNYYIEIPFDQLHFGERDEFIRQRLHNMNTVANNKFMPMEEFIETDLSRLLGFTVLCTINGQITHNWSVGVNDKGLRFVVNWGGVPGVSFTIYKLDESEVFSFDVSVSDVSANYECTLRTADVQRVLHEHNLEGRKCIVDVYSEYFKNDLTLPNFGEVFSDEIIIRNYQPGTTAAVKEYQKGLKVNVYFLKYFNEVPGIYPAANYYNISDCQKIYDDKYENIVDVNGNKIVSSSTYDYKNISMTTPPIVLDRGYHFSFDIITECVNLRDEMMQEIDFIHDIGKYINESTSFGQFSQTIIYLLHRSKLATFKEYYAKYLRGATLSSIVLPSLIHEFTQLITVLENISNMDQAGYDDIKSDLYCSDLFYNDEYEFFLDRITQPFREGLFSNFAGVSKINKDYFNDELVINRPVAEQCFIALQYNTDISAWVFATPKIRHFRGIQNAFYISEDLNGNEVFKFFVLYTKTEAPNETKYEYNEEDALDFDEFYKEMETQIGFIRYWYVENKLMKLSKIMYGKYDQDAVVQVLSKMLQGKIDGADILDYYPSEMNYEFSNAGSDGFENDLDTAERAPFAINFLFYSLKALNDDNDKFQAYFYRHLTNKKYETRYTDIDLSPILGTKKSYPVNYSKISIAPEIDTTESNFNTTGVGIYDASPYITDDGTAVTSMHRYTYQMYNQDTMYPDMHDDTYYLKYQAEPVLIDYNYDVAMAKLIAQYLTTSLSIISELSTNYAKTFNQMRYMNSAVESLEAITGKINVFYTQYHDKLQIEDTSSIVSAIINNNPVSATLQSLRYRVNAVLNVTIPGSGSYAYVNVYRFISDYTTKIRTTYDNYGFVDDSKFAVKHAYEQLKSINVFKQNCYQFGKSLNSVNTTVLSNLESFVSKDTGYHSVGIFDEYAAKFIAIKVKVLENLDDLKDAYALLSGDSVSTHISSIQSYLDDIIQNYMFSMYAIQSITMNLGTEYTKRPKYIQIDVSNLTLLEPPVGTSIYESGDTPSLIFVPIVSQIPNGKYMIQSVAKICEYAFFKGDDVTFSNAVIVFEDGTDTTASITLKFAKMSTTAESYKDFNQIVSYDTTVLDFQNPHEKYQVQEDGFLLTDKKDRIYYELLAGNRFDLVHHVSEKYLDRVTKLQGSVDRIFLENQQMNDYILEEYSGYIEHGIYFKPVQVFHPEITDGVMQNISGKFFEGETAYLKTDDDLFVFPVIIKAIDHAQNKGMIEAEVDSYNTSWTKLTDAEDITKYLTTDVTCTFLDDNLRNFMNEFCSDYGFYANGMLQGDDPDTYTVPGDPVFVQNNSQYVYTRISELFQMENSYPSDQSKQWRFVYLGAESMDSADGYLRIRMLNRNLNPLTNPEMYPILRTEPNDHSVWENEQKLFRQYAAQAEKDLEQTEGVYKHITEEYFNATTKAEKDYLYNLMDTYKIQIANKKANKERFERYAEQLESPTTWFNVHSYDAALVYIENGRAKTTPTFIEHITDIPYTSDIKILLYDWENKDWIDPSTYTVSTQVLQGVTVDPYDDYQTNDVLVSITITPTGVFPISNKLLVYYAYADSNVYDSITNETESCTVRFKPIISSYTQNAEYDPYTLIKLRKQFCGTEKYLFESYNTSDQTFSQDGFYIHRVQPSGKNKKTPVIRMCDVSFTNDDTVYDYDDMDLYIPSPFKDVDTFEKYSYLTYSAEVNADIDGDTTSQKVQLICVEADKQYNGNISGIIFDATITNGVVTITDSNIDPHFSGTFVCTVNRNPRYSTCGGLITVTVTSVTENIVDADGEWIRIPTNRKAYYELPERFILVPNTTIDETKETLITLSNIYDKRITETIDDSIDSSFMYYVDEANHHRLPISNVRRDAHDERLIIDQEDNPDVCVVKSSYIGICRYSRSNIPKDGVIDVTGYIPTPLSKDRYEFWVNGRCVTSKDDVIILSPTSLQLCNMTSLKNFELIELVDDVGTSPVMDRGCVYIGIDGKTYSTYHLALASNVPIISQDYMFKFNANQHYALQDYTRGIIDNPNNIDMEKDILDDIVFGTLSDYQDYTNLPSINGVTLQHVTTEDLGMHEIPSTELLQMYDRVWKKEILTRRPFVTSHRKYDQDDKVVLMQKTSFNMDTTDIVVHVTGTTDRYFTLYLATSSTATIDDTSSVVKVIPFVKTGTTIVLDHDTAARRWLHTTFRNTNTILLK